MGGVWSFWGFPAAFFGRVLRKFAFRGCLTLGHGDFVWSICVLSFFDRWRGRLYLAASLVAQRMVKECLCYQDSGWVPEV